jgi:hypothetical protein
MVQATGDNSEETRAGAKEFSSAGGALMNDQTADVKGSLTINLQGSLTLRDLFAAFALAGLCAVRETTKVDSEYPIARDAYALADAMLEIRKPLEEQRRADHEHRC